MNDNMRVIYGGGEVVGFLEDMLALAREGRIEAIAVATVQSDHHIGGGLAWKRDMASPWVRTVGAVASLQHDLLSGTLSFER